ncbi:MAG: hypothetical protein ACR2M3_11750 [Thermomicrobiales bacterium]
MNTTNHSHIAPTEPTRGGRASIRTDTPVTGQAAASPTRRSVMVPWFIVIVVVLGALLNAMVGILSLFAPATLLASLGQSGEHLTAGTRLFAAYTGAREIPVAVLLVVLLVMRSRLLPALMVLSASVYALDGLDALASGDGPRIAGSFVFAIAFLSAALWLFKQPREREAA